MGGKKHRHHSRLELMERRAADDRRRLSIRPPAKNDKIYDPGTPILYNPVRRSGIVIVRHPLPDRQRRSE